MGIDLSIIIVTWNARELLLRAVASIFREVKGSRFEVIVVDNDSEDGSAAAVEAEFPGVKVIRNPRNLGFAGGNNIGLREAKGRHAVLLNDDTVVLPGAFERLVAWMDANPGTGLCAPQLLDPDGSKQNSIHNFPSLATEILNVSLLRIMLPGRYPSKRQDYAEPIEVEAVLGACLVVRREALEQVGPMDDGYFFFMEETDWCARMREAGWKVVHVPDARITHLSGGSSKKKLPLETRIEYLRSLYRFFGKNRGPVQRLAVISIRLIKLALNLVIFSAISVVTLGRAARARRKAAESARMLLWHLRGCPAGWGLAGAARRRRAGAGS
ncbi:MAG: glycosyltransferase family 2 protein [Deltaproteobacteria bacterium]|nr:glycosyltransferase family 2 protein [Deltaproteobacteria bacterium]